MLSPNIINLCRRLSTTPRMGFKFKLTDEMSKEFEDQQKSQKKSEPLLAQHTRSNTLIMGKVSSDRYKKVVKCGVPKHRFNDFLLMHVRENDDVQALDENDVCKPGDWVLLRREIDPVDKLVTHRVERIVYSSGHIIDPITNRRSFGLYFDDEMVQLEKMKIT